MTNRLELNWKLDGFVDEQRYYCSETQIDPANLPAHKAVLANDVRSYVDAAVEVGKTYYVAVSSVKGSIEKVSQVIEIITVGDEHWDKVVGLYRQEGSNIVDLSTFGGSLITNTGLSVDSNVASPTGTPVLKLNHQAKAIFTTAQLGLDDFTIEMWFRCELSHHEWPRVWATKDSINIGAGHYNAQLRDTTGIAVFAETQWAAERSEDLKNKFSHFAFCKQGDNFYAAINGVVSVEAYTPINDVNGIFTLGQGGSSVLLLWFNEIRITKGVARYTANFTPPDAPFPSY